MRQVSCQAQGTFATSSAFADASETQRRKASDTSKSSFKRWHDIPLQALFVLVPGGDIGFSRVCAIFGSLAEAGPPEGYGHLARQPVAPVPQAPLHVSAHAPPAHAPQLHAPLAHGPPLHAPCQHFAGGFGANGAQYGMPQQA
ncbi:unnamed protein product, partial [Effrenium voratum]